MKQNLLVSKLKPPLALLEKSRLRSKLPNKFVEAQRLWSGVVSNIEQYLVLLKAEGGDVDDFLETINGLQEFEYTDALFKKPCWSWAPCGEIVSFNEIDRLGQHFLGAMYTCEGFEWPQHEGCPYKPLFQLSLEDSSQIAGVDLGSGLLQLFQSPVYQFPENGYLLRHIPRQKVSEEQATPIPCFSKDQEKRAEEVFFETPFWLDQVKCIAVHGFEDKRFSMPYCLDCPGELLDNLESLEIDSFTPIIADLDRAIKLIYELHNAVEDKFWDMSLFGYTETIQMSAWEMPDPLLIIGGCSNLIKDWDEDSRFEIFSHGSGQVYITLNSKGGLCYEFYGDS